MYKRYNEVSVFLTRKECKISQVGRRLLLRYEAIWNNIMEIIKRSEKRDILHLINSTDTIL